MFTANIAANHVFSTLNMAAQHNLSSVNYRYRRLEEGKATVVKLRSIKLSKSEFSKTDIENLINSINETLED